MITSAEFHPQHASQLVYSSSKGLVRLCDLRESARVERQSGRIFGHAQQSENERTFFSEVISSMSDVKFSHNGRYVMARDYMTLKIWDLNMSSSPLRTIKVHEHLRSKLCELYESDCIFDKFEASWVSGLRSINAPAHSPQASFAPQPKSFPCRGCVAPCRAYTPRTRIVIAAFHVRACHRGGMIDTFARGRTTTSFSYGTRLARTAIPRRSNL